MEEKDKATLYLEIYKTQIARFEATRNIQWKVNFGLWTIIAATGSFLYGKYNPSIYEAIIAIGSFAFLHYFFWSKPIQNSLDFDKKLFVKYRQKIDEITDQVSANDSAKPEGNSVKPKGKNATLKTWVWTTATTLFTVIFLIFILYILNKTPIK